MIFYNMRHVKRDDSIVVSQRLPSTSLSAEDDLKLTQHNTALGKDFRQVTQSAHGRTASALINT
jgi:hypothetical protein